jgi:hypothetical protein
MVTRVASANPAKRFFVDMLTRDIELQDAILDLLDNCVDGVMRIHDGTVPNKIHPYTDYFANIDFDETQFSITDNCGGIPIDVAEKYAFRLGRPDDRDDEDLPTVGVYGIGMKRAIFKMGEHSIIDTSTEKDGSFRVEITKEWLKSDKNWELEIDSQATVDLDANGTRITVKSLRDGIARSFSDATGFETSLYKAIAAYYGYIIEKGFTVRLNGKPVEPMQISLMFDQKTFQSGHGMAPFAFRADVDGVSVQLAVGMYREIPTDDEEEQALEGRPSTERAGWTIICNDRVVMYADKSKITGWGDAGVPAYHTQFTSIAGVVVFKSNDAKKLPLTTTKRGIDGNSELYLSVKEYMREGLKLFTDFTYKWKRSTQERSDLKANTAVANVTSIAELVPDDRWTNVRRAGQGQRFRPTLPLPKEDDPVRQIKFSRRASDIEKVGELLFGDSTIGAGEIGAKCFDEFLKKA